jgi:hypothetical protein
MHRSWTQTLEFLPDSEKQDEAHEKKEEQEEEWRGKQGSDYRPKRE